VRAISLPPLTQLQNIDPPVLWGQTMGGFVNLQAPSLFAGRWTNVRPSTSRGVSPHPTFTP